jgi:PTS system fructose-specific IIC component
MYFGCKLMAPHAGCFRAADPQCDQPRAVVLAGDFGGEPGDAAVVYAVIKKGEQVEMVVAPAKG